MNFLLANFFQSSWFLVIILIVAVVLLSSTSFLNRKKLIKEREELQSKICKGTKVRTYSGLYGVVVSTRNTTDGTLVLLETGEGDKKSYQQLHIDAIYSIDYSEEIVIDSEGNEVPLSELNKPKEEKTEEIETTEEPNEETTEENKEVEDSKPVKKTKK